jgi:hypothetical protein
LQCKKRQQKKNAPKVTGGTFQENAFSFPSPVPYHLSQGQPTITTMLRTQHKYINRYYCIIAAEILAEEVFRNWRVNLILLPPPENPSTINSSIFLPKFPELLEQSIFSSYRTSHARLETAKTLRRKQQTGTSQLQPDLQRADTRNRVKCVLQVLDWHNEKEKTNYRNEEGFLGAIEQVFNPSFKILYPSFCVPRILWL